jgi:hypothetical protein
MDAGARQGWHQQDQQSQVAILKLIRPLENQLSSFVLLLLLLLRPPESWPPCTALLLFGDGARRFLFGTNRRGGLPVSTVRLGVLFRRPKAASPPQELEVRAAGGRANF